MLLKKWDLFIYFFKKGFFFFFFFFLGVGGLIKFLIFYEFLRQLKNLLMMINYSNNQYMIEDTNSKISLSQKKKKNQNFQIRSY